LLAQSTAGLFAKREEILYTWMSMVEKMAGLKALEDVRVVLIESKFSGNIGMVARVMKNLGFFDLRLVRPRAELNKEAYALAAHATEVIDQAQIYDDLVPAIADCGLVIGTSRRYGSRRKNLISIEDLPEIIRPCLGRNQLAVVFGSEDAGIKSGDAGHCHWMAGIRPGTEYDSMSISHAAAIVLWEINRLAREPLAKARELAEASELENMFAELAEVLSEIDFIEPGDPRGMMPSFRALFGRAMLTPREASMLRGVWSKTRKSIRHAPRVVKSRRKGEEL